MSRVGIITETGNDTARIESGLAQQGFVCVSAPPDEVGESWLRRASPQLILLHLSDAAKIPGLAAQVKRVSRLPVIALVRPEILPNVNGHLDAVDDFVLPPYDTREMVVRIKRALHKNDNVDHDEAITCGDLLIDIDRCEVSLGGRLIELAFREYALLCFLARNPGRTFTREALLDRVWGDDYYGGDRTVDVHIRRLRSKIEDAEHSFIDTVRNIGYRFCRVS